MTLISRIVIALSFFVSTASHSQVHQGFETLTVRFEKKSSKLSKPMRQHLDQLAMQHKNDTSKYVLINVSYSDLCNGCGARGWDRLMKLQNYFVRKGMDPAHVYGQIELKGETNKAEIRVVPLSQYPATPPPPPHS